MPDASSPYLNQPVRSEEQARADLQRHELDQRWHKEGWVKCAECEGFGFHEDMGDEIPCAECGGTGQVKLPFYDWIDTLDENDPVHVVREKGAA